MTQSRPADSGYAGAPTAPGEHLRALTGLRFVAALFVVAFHTRSAFEAFPWVVRQFIEVGNVGVNLFFVLSGFVLAYNYSGGRLSVRDFWVARFARIYPVYVFALLLFAPAAFRAVPRDELAATAVSSMTLLQAWTQHLSWNTPGWSLSAEAFFYLTFPLLVLAFRGLGVPQLLVWMVGIWLVSLIPASLYVGGTLASISRDVIYYNPLLRLPEFVIGVAAGKMFLQQQVRVTGAEKRRRAWARRLSWLAGCAGTAFVAIVLLRDWVPDALLHNGLLDPVFIALVYGLAGGTGRLTEALSRPTMVLLGEASYSVYILQSPVFVWLKAAVMLALYQELRPADRMLNGSVLFVVAYTLVLVVVSILTLYHFEMPARRALRRALSRRPVSVEGPLPATPASEADGRGVASGASR